MSASIRYRNVPDGLRSPVLIAAFEGWNDAGEAATSAVEALHDATDATVFAHLDPEEFYDFQVNRPTVHWAEGKRVLHWPETSFSYARLDGDRDLVLVSGREPNVRWQTFTASILEVGRRMGVSQVVTMGALQVDRPHTRDVSMTGAASRVDVASRHGLQRSSYEGPTGIVGVLHHAATEAGLDAVTFWAGVPHYLAGTAYQQASLRLAHKAAEILGTDISLEELAEEADQQLSDIAELVAEDSELADYVEELERRTDAEEEPLSGEDLPKPPVSGDELAAELERYLRERPADG